MITIENEQASIKTHEDQKKTMPLKKFVSAITSPDLDLVVPNGVKGMVWKNNMLMVVYEIKPGAYRLEWQEKPDEGYSLRTLALPYVLLLIPFSYKNKVLIPQPMGLECYYRNQPLMDAKDELFLPCLLNCGPWHGLSIPSWICMSRLNLVPVSTMKSNQARLWKTIALVRNYFFGASFNWEWSRHWRMYEESGKGDPRIMNVKTWDAETKKDPSFILGVDWIPAEKNLERTIDYTLGRFIPNDVNTYTYMARYILNGTMKYPWQQ